MLNDFEETLLKLIMQNNSDHSEDMSYILKTEMAHHLECSKEKIRYWVRKFEVKNLIRVNQSKTNLYRSFNAPSRAKVYVLTEQGMKILGEHLQNRLNIRGVQSINTVTGVLSSEDYVVNSANKENHFTIKDIVKKGKLVGKHGIEYRYKIIDFPDEDAIEWDDSWNAFTNHYVKKLKHKTWDRLTLERIDDKKGDPIYIMIHFTINGSEPSIIEKREARTLDIVENHFRRLGIVTNSPELVKDGQYDIINDPVAEFVDRHVNTQHGEIDKTPKPHTFHIIGKENVETYLESSYKLNKVKNRVNQLDHHMLGLKDDIDNIDNKVEKLEKKMGEIVDIIDSTNHTKDK